MNSIKKIFVVLTLLVVCCVSLVFAQHDFQCTGRCTGCWCDVSGGGMEEESECCGKCWDQYLPGGGWNKCCFPNECTLAEH